ncbi:uncharacterized protein LOC130780240 isoform X1 [Actinidia eriantha]|uniref:uncharacterized protein LOC130780240 isoform X1 n=1 Tax=Actinidia eriantha TaxID=165200 RepID=UPI00258FB401|nr:uncharacterized protein LOC130780240 isoform X1 [Actinidia eriantha]
MSITTHQEPERMGDLHAIAYSSNLHSSSLGWDFHNLGVFNADLSHSHFMESSTPPFVSPCDSDFSTGYLQDALYEFSDRSKRRRLLLFSDDPFKEANEAFKSYWDSNQTENCSENFSFMNALNGVSGESMNRSLSRIREEGSIFTEMQTTEEEISASEAIDSASSSHKHYSNSIPYKQAISPGGNDEKRKKRVGVKRRVVYPFAMVKPGGVEGDMTLKDINQRILMPPTRPVKHPVGDYACRPLVVSPDGPGLSGKAVVAFTRIHTQGRGTITIIRTKG